MPHHPQGIHKQLFVAAISVSVCLAVPVHGAADSTISARSTAGLKTIVHLRLGIATLDKVTAALSAQTGLKIEAAPYLNERKLTVQMDNLPARAALRALDELNDWSSAEVEPGRILIARHTVPAPRSIVDLPAAIQSTLPKDLRCFLMVGRTERVTHGEREMDAERVSIAAGNHGSTTYVPLMKSRLDSLENQLAVEMMDSLALTVGEKDRGLGEARRFAYATMLRSEKDMLLSMLLLCSLKHAVVNQAASRLIYGELQPYQIDPGLAELSQHGGSLMIGATKYFTVEDGRTGNVYEGFPAR